MARPSFLCPPVCLLRRRTRTCEAIYGVQRHWSTVGDLDGRQRWRHGRCHHDTARRRQNAHSNPTTQLILHSRSTRAINSLPLLGLKTLHFNLQQILRALESTHLNLLPINHPSRTWRRHPRYLIRHTRPADNLSNRRHVGLLPRRWASWCVDIGSVGHYARSLPDTAKAFREHVARIADFVRS